MSQSTLVQTEVRRDREAIHPGQLLTAEGLPGVARARSAGPTPWHGSQKWLIVGWMIPLLLYATSVLLQNFIGSQSWFLSWPGLLVMAFAIVTAMTDLIWHKIPNWMTYSSALGGVVIGAVVTLNGPSSWAGNMPLGDALFGLGACFACMLIPYRASGGGAGDVKLAAVYGALLGWQAGLSVIITAYIVAGAGLLIMHLCSNHPWLLPQALLRLIGSAWLPQLINAPDVKQKQVLSRPIPLAGAFAVALVSVLCGGNLFAS